MTANALNASLPSASNPRPSITRIEPPQKGSDALGLSHLPLLTRREKGPGSPPPRTIHEGESAHRVALGRKERGRIRKPLCKSRRGGSRHRQYQPNQQCCVFYHRSFSLGSGTSEGPVLRRPSQRPATRTPGGSNLRCSPPGRLWNSDTLEVDVRELPPRCDHGRPAGVSSMR